METKTNKIDTTGFDGAGAVLDDFVGVQNGHGQYIYFFFVAFCQLMRFILSSN